MIRELLRQQAPLATSSQQIKDCVYDSAHIGRAWPLAMASDRQQRLDQFPSSIRQIRLVSSIQHQRVPSRPYDALSLKVDADFSNNLDG
jgi:hypothetical protein